MSQLSDAAPTGEKHTLPVRTLVAASIGNAVEWFDWTIYATFAVYFSSQFFDKSNPTLALMARRAPTRSPSSSARSVASCSGGWPTCGGAGSRCS